MRLREDRRAPALEALDEPQLPQRLRAIEALGEQPPDQTPELLGAARRGQRGVAHVVVEVERWVVDPALATEAERRRGELLAVPGNERQPRAHVLAQVHEVRRR